MAERLAMVVDVPVVEVSLLEDRARVVRRGPLELLEGDARLRIEAVAAVIVDKTLLVSIDGSASVVDARVRRRTVHRATDDVADEGLTPVEALERERDGLFRRLAALEDEKLLLETHAAGLEQIAAQSTVDLAEDVAWGRSIEDEWGPRLDQLRDRERRLRQQLVRLRHDTRELERDRTRLDQRILILSSPAERERAAIEIDVTAAEAGNHTITIEYLVPGACWRPYHTATLRRGDPATVEIATDACVWQNTGEDWDDAQLSFSTERASLGSEPPRLADDVLSWKKKSDTIVVDKREQQIETTGLGVDATVEAQDLPGIDDGGESLDLAAQGRSTVPSDGRPHRVRLASFVSDAELELVAYPELTPSVLLKATLINRGSHPVLAGPVDLVMESGYTGRTSVLFIARDERFELGFGPESELRISREDEVEKEKSRVLSSWATRKHVITVRISNIGASERRVTVTERVPVSEIEKLKIEVDAGATTGGRKPDEDGFVTWQVDLSPFGRETVSLGYTLKKHEDVVGI